MKDLKIKVYVVIRIDEYSEDPTGCWLFMSKDLAYEKAMDLIDQEIDKISIMTEEKIAELMDSKKGSKKVLEDWNASYYPNIYVTKSNLEIPEDYISLRIK